MATGTFFPAFACLIFPSEDFMPYGCVQFRVKRQNRAQEIVTGDNSIMDHLVCWVKNMTGAISGQAKTICIIGTFFLRKPPCAANDLIVLPLFSSHANFHPNFHCGSYSGNLLPKLFPGKLRQNLIFLLQSNSIYDIIL